MCEICEQANGPALPMNTPFCILIIFSKSLSFVNAILYKSSAFEPESIILQIKCAPTTPKWNASYRIECSQKPLPFQKIRVSLTQWAFHQVNNSSDSFFSYCKLFIEHTGCEKDIFGNWWVCEKCGRKFCLGCRSYHRHWVRVTPCVCCKKEERKRTK